jgi:hypothetical protein
MIGAALWLDAKAAVTLHSPLGGNDAGFAEWQAARPTMVVVQSSILERRSELRGNGK